MDRLHFEVPEEWKACTISLHVQRLSGTLPDPQILDENNSVLVGGVPVQPLEWLDPSWVKNNITSRMNINLN